MLFRSELSRLATHYGFIDKGSMVKEVSAAELEAECRKCTRLVVSDTRLLCMALDRIGSAYRVVSRTEADVYGEIKASDLVHVLDAVGCDTISMHERNESLETYYMNLIGGGQNA